MSLPISASLCLTRRWGHAKHRKIGDGFGYEPSMENVDVSPVEAVALAYWNVKTSKRHPGRRAKAVAF